MHTFRRRQNNITYKLHVCLLSRLNANTCHSSVLHIEIEVFTLFFTVEELRNKFLVFLALEGASQIENN